MRKLAVLLLSIAATQAFAADDKEDRSFSAEAEVGALTSTGNTESTAFKGKLGVKHDLLKWRNSYLLEAFYKEDNVDIQDADGNILATESQVTAEKYFLSGQADYKLNEEHRALFVYGSYEVDKFSGYNYQGTLAAGYTDRLFKTPATEFNYSIGPGMAYSETEASVDGDGNYIAEEADSTAIIRLAADFLWQISPNAKFTQVISSDAATDSNKNTKTKSETAVTATLNGSFALKAGYSVQHNSVVRDDIEKTDTQTSITLVYTY